MSQTRTWLVTGSNRGIGLEFVRQLVSSPNNIVIATCRHPDTASDLKALKEWAKGNLYIMKLDVSNTDSIEASVESTKDILSAQGLDYLINNAAVSEGNDLAFDMSISGLMRSFQANVAGPAFIAQTYLPFIERSTRKVIMNMTSGLGSIGLNCGKKNASYSITKTALHMLSYKQAAQRPDLISFVIDPGWVKTDLGGEGATLEPHESVSALLTFVTNATAEHSGMVFRYSGDPLPW
ncbi:hypothetical protein EW146_g8251 [Bondarzewia mesenterica]|uniref:NAD(P)-binding protein n=1 Tax=Bondarzewia mesenterica TaxID=1095465 RepID=A0A4S4LLE6_9AGAM|nr:hypothetical protein EW146_g8251 [Bondarzewia mesenterica]